MNLELCVVSTYADASGAADDLRTAVERRQQNPAVHRKFDTSSPRALPRGHRV